MQYAKDAKINIPTPTVSKEKIESKLDSPKSSYNPSKNLQFVSITPTNNPKGPLDVPLLRRQNQQPQQQAPALELKLYQPPAQQIRQPNYSYTSSNLGSLNYSKPKTGIFDIPQVINNFVAVNDVNPYQNPQTMNIIYEDVLPKNLVPVNITSLYERKTLSNLIQNNVLQNQNGKITKLTLPTHIRTILPILNKNNRNAQSNTVHDLFTKIKTTSLNPYAYDIYNISNNPYKTLPKNFILYQACYPIKNDQGGVVCSPSSSAVNVRLYRLTVGEFERRTDPTLIYSSDPWRDIKLYEYIKNEILNRKISPNFVYLHGYNLCIDSDIDFDKIEMLKNNKSANSIVQCDHFATIENILLKYREQGVDGKLIDDARNEINKYRKSRPSAQLQELENILKKIIDEEIKKNPELKHIYSLDPNRYENHLISALTESPDYMIYKWLSSEYVNNGKAQIMVKNGVRNIYEWESVLFQLLYSFHIMVNKNIYIPSFTLQDNVYIKENKDIISNPKVWRYILSDIDYYIPNFGYTVLIDTKYKSIEKEENKMTDGDAVEPDSTDKTSANYYSYGEFDINNSTDYWDKIIRVLKECLNPDNFKNTFFTLNNGTIPDSDILDLLGIMYDYCNKNIEYKNVFKNCIYMHLTQYLNNRIGTYLSVEEYQNYFGNNDLLTYDDSSKSGDFLIVKDSNKNDTQYKIIQFLRTSKNNKVYAFTKHNKKIILRSFDKSELFLFPVNYTLKQIQTQNNGSRESSDIIETYISDSTNIKITTINEDTKEEIINEVIDLNEEE